MTDTTELPDNVVVTMRCSEKLQGVSGSDRRECLACGEDVWVSPATQESIRRGAYPDNIACLRCVHETEAEEIDD